MYLSSFLGQPNIFCFLLSLLLINAYNYHLDPRLGPWLLRTQKWLLNQHCLQDPILAIASNVFELL